MILLGAKSILVLSSFTFMLIIAYGSPQVGVEWIRNYNPQVLFMIGLFTGIVTPVIFKFGNLGGVSHSHFGICKFTSLTDDYQVLFSIGDFDFICGPKMDGQGRDLSPRLLYWLSLATIFMLCLLTMNNRTYQLLAQIGDMFEAAPAHYCQDEKEQSEADQEPKIKAGCDLIFKAFEMGYVKDLGECGEDDDDLERSVCHKRQKDEPWLHYSYRMLVSSINIFNIVMGDDILEQEKRKFDYQIGEWGAVFYTQRAAIRSEPRSSHHIWTNIPYQNSLWRNFLVSMGGSEQCIQDWNIMRPVLAVDADDGNRQGKILKHSLGHLLFNSSHNQGAGYCVEYKIHWDSPTDICQRLQDNPGKVFQEYGIDREIDTVIDRYENLQYMKNLKARLLPFESQSSTEVRQQLLANKYGVGTSKKTTETPQGSSAPENENDVKELGPRDILSFQCIWQDTTQETTQAELSYRSYNLDLATRIYQETDSVSTMDDRFHPKLLRNLGRSLLPQFDYGAWMSREKPDRIDSSQTIQSLLEHPEYFLLTRLDILKNTDVLLGHPWLKQRPDLLEVYPWYRHLHHFVDKYRQEYRAKKGRL